MQGQIVGKGAMKLCGEDAAMKGQIVGKGGYNERADWEKGEPAVIRLWERCGCNERSGESERSDCGKG